MFRRFLSGLARLRGRRNPQAHYHTSRSVFVVWWCGLLLLHGINLAYYAGVAKLYDSFEHAYVYFQLKTLSIGIDNTQYHHISAIHAFVAAIHAGFIVLMVASSCYARQCVFSPDVRPVYRFLARDPWCRATIGRALGVASRERTARTGGAPTEVVLPKPSATITGRMNRTLSRSGSFLFARDGLLGVDSVYFDHILLLREFLETSLQTFQLYRMTQLLARAWLIRFYVALLVANCWSVPILHRFYQGAETRRRMLCLLCDAVLDMVSSIGVSIVLFVTYATQYNDPDGLGFPFVNWFQDEWLANMQQEFEMMLVASWADMVSRLVFAFGVLQCMDAIKDMLTPVRQEPKKSNTRPPSATSIVPVPIKDGQVVQDSNAGAARNPSTSDIRSVHSPSKHGSSLTGSAPRASKFSRALSFFVTDFGPGLFLLWGGALLAVHGVAENNTTEHPCTLRLKPWLSNKPGCSLVEIDCHALGSTGSDDIIDNALQAFDPERAARLVFRHCPQLELTPRLYAYSQISGLKIYNSTVSVWNDETALTADSHPNIRTLTLVRASLPNGELPHGLLSAHFPPLLSGMITCFTNIRALPSDLDTKWPRGMQLMFEFARLEAIPDVVVRLQPSDVSFAGCPVKTVPAELFEIPWLRGVILGNTLIQELPSNVRRPSQAMNVLFLQGTNITTFWSWMDDFVRYSMLFPTKLFNGFNTPYCVELQEIAQGSRTTFTAPKSSQWAMIMDVSTPQALTFAQRAIDCGPGYPTHFPFYLEDAGHALH